MNFEISDLKARLEACETDLAAHRGYLKALEYGVRTLIITHPYPDLLSRAWASILPGITEAHGPEGGWIFNAAFQQLLSVLTQQIEARGGKVGY